MISDFCSAVPPELICGPVGEDKAPCVPVAQPIVTGGYLERLPMAVVAAGMADVAEVWSFSGRDTDWTGVRLMPSAMPERRFRADPQPAPYRSDAMLSHIRRFGAPDILCVLGLGVEEDILVACAESIRIYNSIDAPALRVPDRISRHFDIVLTGSAAQSADVLKRHPDVIVDILPIGPEFASPLTFRPLHLPPIYDVIYVAAAQPYKRHHMLFDALHRLPRHIRTLCVIGYGELAETLQQEARARGLNIDFIGPPGVSHDAVNTLMNLARMGVVCGVDDGAPAILTEYMLAGLPVLANAGLCCGVQYIFDQTGRTSTEAHFHQGIADMLADLSTFSPRETVLANWTWPHSVKQFASLIQQARAQRGKASGGGAA